MMKAFMLIFLIFLPRFVFPFDPFLTKDGNVEKGNKFYREGKYKEALDAYNEAKKNLPENAILHYAIGITEIGLQKLDDAQKSLERGMTICGDDKVMKEYLFFAMGYLFCEKAKKISQSEKEKKKEAWRKASEYFKEGLILNPENKDLRHNLEVSLLYAYPLCKKIDDKYEPNGNREDAKFITLSPSTLSFKEELMLCPEDTDWFRIPLNSGETLISKIEKKQGSLSLSLFEDDFEISSDIKEGDIKKFTAQKNGNFYLKISGNKGEDGIEYVLNVQVIPPCPRGDDGYEENDNMNSPKELQDGEYPLRICSLDDDWFSYSIQTNEEKSLTLHSEDKKVIFDVEIFDEKGIFVDIKDKIKKDEDIKLNFPKFDKDFKYLLRVFGGGGEGFYILKLGKTQEEDKKGEDKKEKENKENEKEKKEEEEKKEEKGQTPMESLLKELEKNDENLEAKQAILQSPYRDYQPLKDW